MRHASGDFFNRCLELSQLELQEWSAVEDNFSLSALLQEIQALFLPTARTKGLSLSFSHDLSIPAVLKGQRASVYRTILNLVGNALKFTLEGSVQVRTRVTDTLSNGLIPRRSLL